MTKSVQLPSKESTLFKNALKFYENKSYKKGLKTADQILKKFPEHGESLAMKGLFCSHLPDRKGEAHDLIKRGIRADLTSHICWHVLGLYHRADRNYEEALKCYNQALKYDPNNSQISRDVAHMQIHTRNLQGFIETRLDILDARPNIKGNWVSLAVAYHLNGDYQLALDVLSSLQETFRDEFIQKNYEVSEFFLYKNWIMESLGKFEEALEDLEKIRNLVVDSTAWLEAKARLYLKFGKMEYAEVQYQKLIAFNSENTLYLDSLEASRGLAGELNDVNSERRLNLYRDLIKKYPHSFAIKQRFILYTPCNRFEESFKDYIISSFRKGIPSIFVTTRDLIYKDLEKVKVIDKVLSDIITVLESEKKFNGQTEVEPPTTILWAYFYNSQHLDWKNQYSESLKMIDKAIYHTPTLLEAYMIKAKLLKHSGSVQSAAEEMDKARKLDLQDRFINSKCAKYMFRAGRIQEAEKIVCLFTRVGMKNPLQDLVDMQCSWFSIESARAFARANNPGRALKALHQVSKTFEDLNDDQFDFHTYSIRKMTLRSYQELLEMSDKLRSHPFYREAAILAVETYLDLHDKPLNLSLNEDLENMSLSEKKKAQRKAKKAELKNAENSIQFSDKTPDEDHEGLKLLEGDPLMNVMPFLSSLLQYSPENLKAQILGAKIYMRRKKYILALKCLKKANALSPQDADVFKAIVDFHKLLETAPDLEPQVKKAIESGSVLGVSLTDYIKSWTLKAKTAHQLWISWLVLENNGMKNESIKFLEKINISTPGTTHQVLVLILNSLKKQPSLYDRILALGKQIFPVSETFSTI